MGGSKTVNPKDYISKRDPSRDVAIAMMMQQAQQQQMANQAEMLKQYSAIKPYQQTYDPSAVSKRAAELGVQNILTQRELDRLTSPEAAKMRLDQSKEIEQLTSPEASQAYMREYMRTQGLPSQYETGLGDSTIGRAAMYDRALQAKKAYEDSLALQQQAYLARTAEPTGGISPEASIAALQTAQAQNIAAQEAYKQGMLGSVGAFNQMGANAAAQQYANLAGLQNTGQQSQQAYNQMLLSGAAQNAAAQNAMTGAYIDAGGKLASSTLGSLVSMAGGAGGGGGLLPTGGYGSMAGMQKATIPGTTGSYVSGAGYVPRATLAK
jgi:hypothetical protein